MLSIKEGIIISGVLANFDVVSDADSSGEEVIDR
jgi:hypothetical protein